MLILIYTIELILLFASMISVNNISATDPELFWVKAATVAIMFEDIFLYNILCELHKINKAIDSKK